MDNHSFEIFVFFVDNHSFEIFVFFVDNHSFEIFVFFVDNHFFETFLFFVDNETESVFFVDYSSWMSQSASFFTARALWLILFLMSSPSSAKLLS